MSTVLLSTATRPPATGAPAQTPVEVVPRVPVTPLLRQERQWARLARLAAEAPVPADALEPIWRNPEPSHSEDLDDHQTDTERPSATDMYLSFGFSGLLTIRQSWRNAGAAAGLGAVVGLCDLPNGASPLILVAGGFLAAALHLMPGGDDLTPFARHRPRQPEPQRRDACTASASDVVLPRRLTVASLQVLAHARACMARVDAHSHDAQDAAADLEQGLFGLAADLRLLEYLVTDAHTRGLTTDSGALTSRGTAWLSTNVSTTRTLIMRRLHEQRQRVLDMVDHYTQVAHDVEVYVATLATMHSRGESVADAATGLRARLGAVREIARLA